MSLPLNADTRTAVTAGTSICGNVGAEAIPVEFGPATGRLAVHLPAFSPEEE